MNLSLFHFDPNDPHSHHKMKDKLNSRTGLLACRFLEWTGWYDYMIAQRLLGHYRLFQHFRKDYAKFSWPDMTAARAYILNYKATHGLKYFLARLMSFIYTIFTPKEYYRVAQVAGVNHLLIKEHPFILEEFLEGADLDFEEALKKAMHRITDPYFLSMTTKDSFAPAPATEPALIPPVQLSQFNHTVNNYATYNHQYNTLNNNISNVNIQPVLRDGAKGKESGIFTKRQILIFFDLLSGISTLEKVDLTKTAKFDGIAALLHALTGKSKESFIDEMKDHRNNGLYAFNTPGERNELIGILNNLSDAFRKAGFRSLATQADLKIKELDATKKNGPID